MTVWSHLPTILKRRFALRIAGLIALCVALNTTLLFGAISHATTGVNQTLSFQGRLLTANGGTVPDGNYNIQFKIYQDGNSSGSGTLKWTENHVNNNGSSGIKVKNGYFSVDLGSVTPFGSSVDWNQDTLWLSMNVGGSSASCTTFGAAPCVGDGEMLPMRRISAVPQAINSQMVGGKTADNFVQIAQGVQTDASTNTPSIFLNKTGSGNLLQLQNNAADVYTVTNAGDMMFGGGDNHAIFINSSSAGVDGKQLAISGGSGGSGSGSAGGTLSLQGGNAGGTNGNGGNIQIDAGTKTGTGISGFISIGATNAGTINIGSNTAAITQNINIGTNTTTGSTSNVTIGSNSGSSQLALKAGDQGIRAETSGGFTVHTNGTNRDSVAVDQNGKIDLNTSQGSSVNINSSVGFTLLSASDDGITTGSGTEVTINGQATFNQGIVIQGSGANTYTTPEGNTMSTAITIPNYAVPSGGSVFAFGLPSNSDASAHGLLIADGRTGTHSATIGVLSPDESATMGLSWNGSNSTGYLTNTANSLALQGNGLNLLTATNNGGAANIGIGNAATSGYALDVTGDTNTSGEYRINGTTTLSSSELTFSGTSGSVITSAANQTLTLNGQNGLTIQSNSLTSAKFTDSNVQIGDGTDSSALTLLTLDQAAAAPGAGNSILGSMYYDTTLGKVQCYEASGWGNCGSAPDSFVSLSPEFANSVMNGTGNGTMNSDLCSDSLNINDGSSSQPTICGTNETYNFYKWTSAQNTAQTKSIFVTYQLPTSFKEFVSGTTSLTGRVDNTTNANVSYQIYRKDADGLTACGTSIDAATSANAWQKVVAENAADPANCSFEAGDSIVIKITASAKSDANAYISDLNFVYSNND